MSFSNRDIDGSEGSYSDRPMFANLTSDRFPPRNSETFLQMPPPADLFSGGTIAFENTDSAEFNWVNHRPSLMAYESFEVRTTPQRLVNLRIGLY